MTVKEFYEMAVKNGVENEQMIVTSIDDWGQADIDGYVDKISKIVKKDYTIGLYLETTATDRCLNRLGLDNENWILLK